MGERTLRRLLIVASGSWLARMLARKPPMLVIVALANKTARIAWALIAKGGVYQAPVPAA
jgi:transposase